jgi:S1-C subfamily serine protease
MSELLKTFSDAMADLVEQAGSSIVRVEARRRLPASGVVWSSDGLIVTSHHVVESEENIQIGLAGGGAVEAKLVGRDPGADLALLRAEIGDLQAAQWVDAGNLRVGHLALALGRPGQTVQATLGIVSALGGAWRTPAGGQLDHYLQTDVVMYPGFSGGPLVTANGQIAGINTSALARGVSLTVPSGTIRRVVETLLAHGRVPRGYLGVGIQPVRLAKPIQTELGQETGLMLMSVEADGPAGQAGMAQGDILVTLDSHAVRHIDDLQGLLSGERVGKSAPARIVRGGQVQTVTVTVGQYPQEA